MRTNSCEDIGIVLALRLDFKGQLTNAFTTANKRPLLHYKTRPRLRRRNL